MEVNYLASPAGEWSVCVHTHCEYPHAAGFGLTTCRGLDAKCINCSRTRDALMGGGAGRGAVGRQMGRLSNSLRAASREYSKYTQLFWLTAALKGRHQIEWPQRVAAVATRGKWQKRLPLQLTFYGGG